MSLGRPRSRFHVPREVRSSVGFDSVVFVRIIPKRNHKRNTYIYTELNLSKQVKSNRYHYKQCESRKAKIQICDIFMKKCSLEEVKFTRSKVSDVG